MTIQTIKHKVKFFAKKILVSAKNHIVSNPKLKQQILSLFAPFPKLEKKIIKLGTLAVWPKWYIKEPKNRDQLPPRAIDAYDDMLSCIQSKGGIKG